MINRINIYFQDNMLKRNLEDYSQKYGKSFSEAVIEFVAAGFSLFQKTGSLDVDLLMERDRSKDQRLREAHKQIGFLKKIIETKLLGKPGDVEKVKDSSPSNVEMGSCHDQDLKFSKVLGKPLRRDPRSKNWGEYKP